tara:strand:- start:300 stop:698 length:399 start_codon:yes stop_codon:yes gene_type:complete
MVDSVINFKNFKKMKKYICVVFLFASFLLKAQDSSNKQKTTFKVHGNCEMCKMRIEKAALSLKGVKYAKWSIPDSQLTLIYNPNRLELLDIHDSVALSGHDTSLKDAPADVYNELPICCLYIRAEKIKPRYK